MTETTIVLNREMLRDAWRTVFANSYGDTMEQLETELFGPQHKPREIWVVMDGDKPFKSPVQVQSVPDSVIYYDDRRPPASGCVKWVKFREVLD